MCWLVLFPTLLSVRAASGITEANVVQFGAVGDGLTDDTDCIEQALQNVTATGGILYFPPGMYAISRALVVSGNSISLVGAGAHPESCTYRYVTI